MIAETTVQDDNLAYAENPFDRCGTAALSDLQSQVWRELYSRLEVSQADFLSKQHLFRSPGYKWPLDSLHWWSRVWEYPYVYLHLARWRREYAGHNLPKVADIGSGVTFFPFSVARLGFAVVCSDPDPVCSRDLNRARETIEQSPGNVEFRLIGGSSLPLGIPNATLYIVLASWSTSKGSATRFVKWPAFSKTTASSISRSILTCKAIPQLGWIVTIL